MRDGRLLHAGGRRGEACPRPHVRSLVWLIALTLFAAACGDSSPVRPGPPPPPPTPRVTFLPSGANPGEDAIALGLSTATADTFTLVLRADGVTDLYGYGVDIVFDPTVVTFVSASAGTFLDDTLNGITTQVVEEPMGTLVIGQSRIGAVSGASGSGTLLRLDFVAAASGSTTFATQNAGAFDSLGEASAIDFFGGTATVPATAR